MTSSEMTSFNVWKVIEESRWGQLCLLSLVGLFSFTYNLQISLFEGTEGLYGQIAREMYQSRDFVELTFQGQSYFNKPPLFFWMIGGLTQVFGDNEVALRLTGSLFSLGTMVLVFALGRTLFSWNVGFWAAFVFATNHVFLWYGRRVLTDSPLTFFMTLALFGWVMASRKDSSPAWAFLTFLGMSLATMVKGYHGFVLPFLLIVTYSLWVKNFRPLKQWGFWLGLILVVVSVKVSLAMLGSSARFQFSWDSILFQLSHWSSFSSTAGSFKIPRYFHLVWFDLLPWSVLLPSTLLFLFSLRPLKQHSGVLFILLWFLGYFFILCLSRYKREPYLMPLVPAFAVMIGFYLEALTSRLHIPPWHRIMNGVAFSILTVTIVAAGFFGTSLLQKKWNVAPDFLPVWYLIVFGLLGGYLIWTALKGQYHLMRRGLLGVGLCFVFGIVHIFLPAMDAAGSPRIINLTIREIAAHSPMPIFHYGLTQEDIIYYMNADPPIPRLQTRDELIQKIKEKDILIVTDNEDARNLLVIPELVVKVQEEFPQAKGKKFLLLLISPKIKGP